MRKSLMDKTDFMVYCAVYFPAWVTAPCNGRCTPLKTAAARELKTVAMNFVVIFSKNTQKNFVKVL